MKKGEKQNVQYIKTGGHMDAITSYFKYVGKFFTSCFKLIKNFLIAESLFNTVEHFPNESS